MTTRNAWFEPSQPGKTNRSLAGWLALAALALCNFPSSTALAQPTTAFTYQGQLSEDGGPANGFYDLRFSLYDALTNGNVIGALTNPATVVSYGLFTATLDFGGVFNGSNYWLELAVRANGDGAFTTLSPRQPILPTPYALYSATAGSAATATAAASFTGNIADLQLSPNVPLLNGTNSFTGTNNFAGVTLATNADNLFNGTFTGNLAGNATTAASAAFASTATTAAYVSAATLTNNLSGNAATATSAASATTAGYVTNSPLTNALSGPVTGSIAGASGLTSGQVTTALGYTPPANTYAGISNAVQFLIATNGGPVDGANLLTGSVTPGKFAATYGFFYSIDTAEGVTLVIPGGALSFPNSGPASGIISSGGGTSFTLPAAGVYEVTWQVGVVSAAAIVLALNGVELPQTVVANVAENNQSTQYTGDVLIQATAGAVLQLRNPSAGVLILAVGGSRILTPPANTLVIKQLQ